MYLLREQSFKNSVRPTVYKRSGWQKPKWFPYGSQKSMEGFSMKRFSWIFALIMALTMAFVFTACPSDPDPDPGSSGNGNHGNGDGNNYVLFSLTEEAGKAQIKWDSQNTTDITENDGWHEPGTVAITNNGRGYKYTYGDGAGTASENVILRFKYDLGGEKSLDDYGYVTFTWNATQPDGYKSDINSNKRLYLLASKTEDDLIGYKSRDALGPFVISPYIDDNWYAGAQGDAGAPLVNGNGDLTITLPISSAFMGEVWFAIYVHGASGAGTYTIKDFYFGGSSSALLVSPANNPDAPVEVIVEPDGEAYSFDLDLSQFVTSSGVSGGAVTPTITAGVLSANFTANDQRLIIALTAQQYAAVNSRINSKVDIEIEGEVKTDGDPSGDLFRYHIGDASSGGNWNDTSGAGNATFEAILTSNQTFGGERSSSYPKHFILQHRNVNAVTIEISKINITVYLADNTPAFFRDATGITAVGVYGDATNKYAHTIITSKGNGGFSVDFPAGFTRFDEISIQYACMLMDGTEVKFVSKQVSGWDDVNPAAYPSLATNAVNTLTAKGYSKAGIDAGKAFFQTNGNFEARIKIISVTRIEGEITEFDPVDDFVIPDIKTPKADRTPVTAITASSQWTAAVEWTDGDNDPVDGDFEEGGVYTATITLTAKGAFTFNGVDADVFTVAGKPATNTAGTGSGANTTLVVTITFDEVGPPAADRIVNLATATNPLTTGSLLEAANYSGYAVIFPALEDFDIEDYTKITIEVEYKDDEGEVVAANWWGMVKIGKGSNGQDAGLWDAPPANIYLTKYNLGNQTSNVALSAGEVTALGALSTATWGVRLIKSSGTATFDTITLTGIKFHN
jgi:hypothetical protein